MLGEQRLADQLQHRAPAERRPAAPASLAANGSITSNTALTSRSSRASATVLASASAITRRRWRRQVLHLDRAAARISARRCRARFRALPSRRRLAPFRAGDPRPELHQRIFFLERRQSHHDRDAEPEQRHHALMADPKSERQRRNHVRALESGGVDAFADDQRPRGQARRSRHGRDFGHGPVLRCRLRHRQPLKTPRTPTAVRRALSR